MRDLLRFCGLSYAIVMLSISKRKKGGMTSLEIVDYLSKKKLATSEELKKLGFLKDGLDENHFSPNGGAMQVWYIPIMWAARIVPKERVKGKS